MAEETEAVFALFVFSIKFMREWQSENKGVIRSVRIMTGSTVSLNHRAVLKPSLLPYIIFFMALVADGISLINKKVWSV